MTDTTDCLFCSIVAGDVPADVVHDDEDVIAFRDIAPRAPVHVLVVPKAHVPSVHALTADHDEVVLHSLAVAREVAEAEGVADGYRMATNVGAKGGQAIAHLHWHVIGGRQLGHIDSGDGVGDVAT